MLQQSTKFKVKRVVRHHQYLHSNSDPHERIHIIFMRIANQEVCPEYQLFPNLPQIHSGTESYYSTHCTPGVLQIDSTRWANGHSFEDVMSPDKQLVFIGQLNTEVRVLAIQQTIAETWKNTFGSLLLVPTSNTCDKLLG